MGPAARALLRALHLVRDQLLSSFVLLPIVILSALWLPQQLQRRLIFQESMYFFSDTTKGRAYCLASATIVFLVFVGFLAWQVFFLLGYQQALPIYIFSC